MIILRKRFSYEEDPNGREKTDYFGPLDEPILQLIANHMEPYIGPLKIELMLLNQQPVISKHGSEFYIKEPILRN